LQEYFLTTRAPNASKIKEIHQPNFYALTGPGRLRRFGRASRPDHAPSPNLGLEWDDENSEHLARASLIAAFPIQRLSPPRGPALCEDASAQRRNGCASLRDARIALDYILQLWKG
jgi:hypothetical protein